MCWWSNNACAIYLPFQFFPGTLPEVPAVLLGVLGVSSREGSHGELVLKDGHSAFELVVASLNGTAETS